MRKFIAVCLINVILLLSGGYGQAYALTRHNTDHSKSLGVANKSDQSDQSVYANVPVIKPQHSGSKRKNSDRGAAENEEEEKEEKDERERESRTHGKQKVSANHFFTGYYTDLPEGYFKYIVKSLSLKKHYLTFLAFSPEESLNTLFSTFLI